VVHERITHQPISRFHGPMFPSHRTRFVAVGQVRRLPVTHTALKNCSMFRQSAFYQIRFKYHSRTVCLSCPGAERRTSERGDCL
jgi:hypothetical protein